MNNNDDSEYQVPKIDIKPALDALSAFSKNMKLVQEMVQEIMENI